MRSHFNYSIPQPDNVLEAFGPMRARINSSTSSRATTYVARTLETMTSSSVHSRRERFCRMNRTPKCYRRHARGFGSLVA
jgi:hypothetical protein